MMPIANAIARGTAEWWNDPAAKRHVLRTRAGTLFDIRFQPKCGWFIRRRRENLFD